MNKLIHQLELITKQDLNIDLTKVYIRNNFDTLSELLTDYYYCQYSDDVFTFSHCNVFNKIKNYYTCGLDINSDYLGLSMNFDNELINSDKYSDEEILSIKLHSLIHLVLVLKFPGIYCRRINSPNKDNNYHHDDNFNLLYKDICNKLNVTPINTYNIETDHVMSWNDIHMTTDLDIDNKLRIKFMRIFNNMSHSDFYPVR